MSAVIDSRQAPLFDVRQFVPKPYDDWSFFGVLERFAPLIIRREDFPAPPAVDVGGETPWCPVLLSKLELLRQKHGWADREAVQAAHTDMRFKACLGLGLDQSGPSQPTLSRHRQLMTSLGLDEVYMRRFVDLVRVLSLLELDEPVLVDSTPVGGAGQVLDTYNLLAAATRKGLQHIARVSGEPMPVVAARLGLSRYEARSVKGSFDIDWTDAKQRAEVLAQIVADALRVREALSASPPQPSVQPPSEPPAEPGDDDSQPALPLSLPVTDSGSAERTAAPVQAAGDGASEKLVALIDEIIDHDVERDSQGRVTGVLQRAAGDRPISATDPDMRHGRKSASVLIAGYKAQLVSSTLYGWLLVATVVRANSHDGKALPDLVHWLVNVLGLRPAWMGGDHAYGTLNNHHFFDDRLANGEPLAELIARMPRPTNGGRYTKDEFAISFGDRTLTCPAGQVATSRTIQRGDKSGWLFEFDPARCATCPFRKSCISSKAKADTGRSVFVVPADERLIREHLKERTEPQFLAKLHARSLVERAIAGFAQSGGKTARRFGQRKVDFGINLSALAYNFRRLGALAARDQELRGKLGRVVLRPRTQDQAACSQADSGDGPHALAPCARPMSPLVALLRRLVRLASLGARAHHTEAWTG